MQRWYSATENENPKNWIKTYQDFLSDSLRKSFYMFRLNTLKSAALSNSLMFKIYFLHYYKLFSLNTDTSDTATLSQLVVTLFSTYSLGIHLPTKKV
jgi:hypothetical protein